MLRMASIPDELEAGGGVRLDRRDPYLRLQSVTIYVRDLERSLEFYTDVLGFHLVFDARKQPGPRGRWVTVAPPDGSANLTLVAPEEASEQYKLIGRQTQVSFVTEDVLAKFREWSKRGVRFQSTPRLKRLQGVKVHGVGSGTAAVPAEDHHAPIWGGVYARFRDLDGNTFSLVSFDEVTHAVEAQRRAIAEKQENERRVGQELEIATQVQSRLFPQNQPSLRTLEYAGICHQARRVGGDYYDFLDLGSKRLGLVIGDISGKGIAAALLMANLQANLRSQCANAVDQPQRLLQAVNRLFCDNTTNGAFATLFFAEYDDTAGRLRYVNCGHLPALLLRRDGALERLESTATVLGVFKKWECELAECQLFPGDTLALYTDGITESFSERGEEFGEERLIEVLRCHQDRSSSALLTAAVEAVQGFTPHEQNDDITLIVAKCLAE
jgi:serine phosphatase RsbU (regulator of sigma subunit)/catechol 2,3-dioxygenase-like lactoylglutathione lyase family enzyme